MFTWFLLISCESEEAAFGIATSLEATSEVTWYEDVQPIIEQHCVRCHIEDGVAMGDFRNVDDVIALAPLMHVAMSEGWMPPPTSDPSCRDYYDSEILHMSDESIRTFARWMNNDYAMGDSANAKQYNKFINVR